MMRSHFEDLRRLKAFQERRDLPIRTIAEETGLSQGAILRVKNLSMERVYLSTLETLCRYFEVESLSELIEFVPDADPQRRGEAAEERATITARGTPTDTRSRKKKEQSAG